MKTTAMRKRHSDHSEPLTRVHRRVATAQNSTPSGETRRARPAAKAALKTASGPASGSLARAVKCLDLVPIATLEKCNRHQTAKSRQAWKAFRGDRALRRSHAVSASEMKMLSQVALMGGVRNARDFVFILSTLRQVFKS